MMFCAILLFIPVYVSGLTQNTTCPSVTPLEVDIRGLDGIWYVSAAATEINIEGNCSTIVYNHKGDSTTEVSIQWVANKTLVEYNGTATAVPNGEGDVLNVVFPDQLTINYTVLTISYEHYALLYYCNDNEDGNSSSYELWKLSRLPHMKEKHIEEMDSVLANNNITSTGIKIYTNVEEACVTNGAFIQHVPIALMGSALITVYRHAFP